MIHKKEILNKEEPIINNDLEKEKLERDINNQELIDALETCITKLETAPNYKQLVHTVTLICKILSVELDKTLFNGKTNIYT